MKHKYIKYLAASLIICGVTSCNENMWDDGYSGSTGELELSSLTIALKDAQKVVVNSRAVSTDDFLIKVTNNNGKVMGSWTYKQLPEILTLPKGDGYSLHIESHSVQPAEWDNPYYMGDTTFNIAASKITHIGEVTARFASLKVSINFSDELKKVLTDGKVVVKAENGASLEYLPTSTKIGYFAFNSSTTYAAHFEGYINGIYTENVTPFTNVAAGQHHILTYSVKGTPEIPEQSGSVGNGDIDLNVEYNVEDEDGNVEVGEDVIDGGERPGTEDPEDNGDDDTNGDDNNGDDPQTEKSIKFDKKDSENLSLTDFNVPSDDFGNAIIIITSKNGISAFELHVSTTNPALPGMLEGMGLLNCDMIHPNADAKDAFDNMLNLPYGDQIEGEKEVEFDITNFVPILGSFNGDHSFTMIVSDTDGTTESLSLKFRVTEVQE